MCLYSIKISAQGNRILETWKRTRAPGPEKGVDRRQALLQGAIQKKLELAPFL
jgi:hypothetical protein